MSNPTLIKTFTAGGAITKRRLVKMGSADTAVVQSAAAADSTIGVAGELDAEQEAKRRRVGLWRGNFETPWEWRRGHRCELERRDIPGATVCR